MQHGGDDVEELTADHQEVDELFDQVEAVPARGPERRRLLDRLTLLSPGLGLGLVHRVRDFITGRGE